jgi:inner membrane transporter RhtA
MLYLTLGHQVANTGSRDSPRWGGVDQLGAAMLIAAIVTMARLHRATFALMLSSLPASATVIGLLVVTLLPTVNDPLGVALVIAVVAIHQRPTQHTDREEAPCGTRV